MKWRRRWHARRERRFRASVARCVRQAWSSMNIADVQSVSAKCSVICRRLNVDYTVTLKPKLDAVNVTLYIAPPK